MRMKTNAAASSMPDDHNPIRACVAAPGFRSYFTWYRSGNIVQVVDGEAEQAGRTYSLEGFNAVLERHGVVRLSYPKEGKRPERLETEHGTRLQQSQQPHPARPSSHPARADETNGGAYIPPGPAEGQAGMVSPPPAGTFFQLRQHNSER